MQAQHKRRTAIWYWLTRRKAEENPRIPRRLLNGLPDRGVAISPTAQGDPWSNEKGQDNTNEEKE